MSGRLFSRALSTAAVSALLLTGCGTGNDTGAGGGGGEEAKGQITIGAFNFTESTILANVYAGALKEAGYDVTVRQLTNREVVEPALEKGDLDVVPEYLSTLTEFLNKAENGPEAEPQASGDVDKTLEALRGLAEDRGLEVLEPSEAADQNAFAVTEKFAKENDLETLSDLGEYSGKLVLGGPAECPTRPFCRPGLEKTYGIQFAGFKALDAGGPLTKTALQKGDIQLGLIFSSDPGIESQNLRVLTDDKNLQNPDNVVPVLNADASDEELVEALNGVSEALTTDKLIDMNKKGDIDRQPPQEIAQDFLKEEGLV